jgi:hypothetical protein
VAVAGGESLVYAVERASGDLPAHIEFAVVLVVASALAFAADWLKRY